MELDVFILATFAVFALVGAFQGAAAQILRLVGAVVAVLFGWRAGVALAGALEPVVPLGQATLALGSIVVATIGIYAAASVGGYVLTKLLGKSKPLGRVNRTIGAGLGGAKAVLVWFVVLSVATAFDLDGIGLWGGKTAGDLARSSYAFRVSSMYNPLDTLAAVRRVETVEDRLRTPEGRAEIARGPAFQSLRAHPKVQAVLDDPAMKKALAERRLIDLLGDAKVRALATDAEVRTLARDFLLEASKPRTPPPSPGG